MAWYGEYHTVVLGVPHRGIGSTTPWYWEYHTVVLGVPHRGIESTTPWYWEYHTVDVLVYFLQELPPIIFIAVHVYSPILACVAYLSNYRHLVSENLMLRPKSWVVVG